MLSTYKNWKNGDTVYLVVRDHGWKVEVKMSTSSSLGGLGWFSFARDMNLQVGDVLLLRTVPGEYDVYVGLIKKADTMEATPCHGEEHNKRVSFFQFASEESLKNNILAPPFIVTENYYKIMSKVSSVICGGSEWPFVFWKCGDYFKGCRLPFEEFKVQIQDTIFITISGDSKAEMRIYRKNGMEAMYNKGPFDVVENNNKWYLDEIFDEDFMDESSRNDDSKVLPVLQQENASTHQTGLFFSEKLIASHVDNKSHGMYLSKTMEPQFSKWNRDTKIVLHVKQDSWQVGVNITNNRIRLCSGWNKFVRDNELEVEDTLTFFLLPDGASFIVDIAKKPEHPVHRDNKR